MRKAILLLPCLCLKPLLSARAEEVPQLSIPLVEKMARVPSPMEVRPWKSVAQRYYRWILDPNNKADGFPVVKIEPGKPGFLMKTYLNQAKIDGGSCEAMAALSPVIGAKLVGLDATKMHGVDYVQRSKAWYDPRLGLYRNRPGDSSPIVHADIYGYWPAILGMMLAAQYPGDAEFQAQLKTSIAAFKTIAQGMGAPEQPNFFAYGWDFGKQAPGGRLEPMNRLGHAPSVAWPLMIDASLNGDLRSGRDATAIMKWYEHHPGRYEISHMMGPLTAARLNAMSGGEELDLGKSLNAWFGDGDAATHPWKITAGINFNGRTVDGLDAARSGNSDADFYAFTMGSLQGPAWLVPVARYDQRYARAIARYALHAANSARYLQGEGLDAEHQDHAAWKAKWDKDNLLFYEGLRSKNFGETPGLQPYATGDPVVNGWGTGRPAIKDKTQYLLQREQWFGKRSDNLALYMGNHVGFLGGIELGTNVSGILRWDCLATDWFHPPAYPTSLFYNPHSETEKVTVRLAKPASLYDTVSGRFLATNVKSRFQLQLAPDQSVVLVEVEPSAQLERKNGKLLADGIVVDYRVQRN